MEYRKSGTLNGIGALKDVTLGFYHIHTALGDSEFKVYGGHLF